MSLGLVITHAAHIPERVESMQRLRAALGEDRPVRSYFEETTRAPFWVWAELQWSRAAEWHVDHVLFLQDDVTICDPSSFWPHLNAMVAAHPTEILGLDCAHPGARRVFLDGHAGYTTADGLVGLAYVFPIDVLCDFNVWRAVDCTPNALGRVTEDSLIGLFAMATGRRIWHPTPSPIDHDLSLASTFGNDAHGYRRPQVTTQDMGVSPHAKRPLGDVACWRSAREEPHLGRFYETLHTYLPLVLRDTKRGESLLAELQKDECPPRYARFFRKLVA